METHSVTKYIDALLASQQGHKPELKQNILLFNKKFENIKISTVILHYILTHIDLVLSFRSSLLSNSNQNAS